MAMIVLSSPATLTGSEEKKTGPSRFRPLYSGGWVDTNFTDWHELFRSQELGVGIKKSGNRMNGFRFQVSGKKVQGSGGRAKCQVSGSEDTFRAGEKPMADWKNDLPIHETGQK
jgi:hypothetical protein